ncbi:MAG: histone-like protein [Candidatus Thermoplasmatota archaeon]
MKEAGATRIAKDSIEFMSGLIEGYVKSTTGKAVIFMEHAKRKILTSKDLELTQLNP